MKIETQIRTVSYEDIYIEDTFICSVDTNMTILQALQKYISSVEEFLEFTDASLAGEDQLKLTLAKEYVKENTVGCEPLSDEYWRDLYASHERGFAEENQDDDYLGDDHEDLYEHITLHFGVE